MVSTSAPALGSAIVQVKPFTPPSLKVRLLMVRSAPRLTVRFAEMLAVKKAVFPGPSAMTLPDQLAAVVQKPLESTAHVPFWARACGAARSQARATAQARPAAALRGRVRNGSMAVGSS